MVIRRTTILLGLFLLGIITFLFNGYESPENTSEEAFSEAEHLPCYLKRSRTFRINLEK